MRMMRTVIRGMFPVLRVTSIDSLRVWMIELQVDWRLGSKKAACLG